MEQAKLNPNAKLAEAMRKKTGNGFVIEDATVQGSIGTIPAGTNRSYHAKFLHQHPNIRRRSDVYRKSSSELRYKRQIHFSKTGCSFKRPIA